MVNFPSDHETDLESEQSKFSKIVFRSLVISSCLMIIHRQQQPNNACVRLPMVLNRCHNGIGRTLLRLHTTVNPLRRLFIPRDPKSSILPMFLQNVTSLSVFSDYSLFNLRHVDLSAMPHASVHFEWHPLSIYSFDRSLVLSTFPLIDLQPS